MARAFRPPQYPNKPHKSGQARIKIRGRTYYLGTWGSPQSRAEYRRLLADLEAGRPPAPRRDQSRSALTVDQLVADYSEYAKHRKYTRDGRTTKQWGRVRRALGYVLDLFGPRPVAEFDQGALELVQQEMVRDGFCRTYINCLVGCVRRCWKWGARRKRIASDLYADLCLVEDLAKGEAGVREGKRLKPVAWEHVEQTLPFLLVPVATMVQLQWLTGMRSGEVVAMRLCDIDRSGADWLYRPAKHKTDYLGFERVVVLGPRCQKLLQPYLDRPADAWLFSPREAMALWAAAQRRQRKNKVQPSQRWRDAQRARARKLRQRKRVCYDNQTYGRAVARAAAQAGVPHWRPYQLRHAAATRIRALHGPDAARALLGQRSLQATEIYAEVDLDTVRRFMRKLG